MSLLPRNLASVPRLYARTYLVTLEKALAGAVPQSASPVPRKACWWSRPCQLRASCNADQALLLVELYSASFLVLIPPCGLFLELHSDYLIPSILVFSCFSTAIIISLLNYWCPALTCFISAFMCSSIRSWLVFISFLTSSVICCINLDKLYMCAHIGGLASCYWHQLKFSL